MPRSLVTRVRDATPVQCVVVPGGLEPPTNGLGRVESSRCSGSWQSAGMRPNQLLSIDEIASCERAANERPRSWREPPWSRGEAGNCNHAVTAGSK